jgi:hypothetical protein
MSATNLNPLYDRFAEAYIQIAKRVRYRPAAPSPQPEISRPR